MDEPLVNDEYPTSGVTDDNDVVIHHQEYDTTLYKYECGKSFLDICLEMGLDSADTHISLL